MAKAFDTTKASGRLLDCLRKELAKWPEDKLAEAHHLVRQVLFEYPAYPTPHAAAEAWARQAANKHFSTRRGIFIDDGKLVIFNNNPYRDGSRDTETETLREHLAAIGIRQVAYATYPPNGEDAGYSYAMMLDCGEERFDEVNDTITKVSATHSKSMNVIVTDATTPCPQPARTVEIVVQPATKRHEPLLTEAQKQAMAEAWK